MTQIVVYQATNTVNGSRYIGVTMQGLDRRIADHIKTARRGGGYRFGDAIRRHGDGAFKFHTLVVCPNYQYALKMEVAAISAYQPEYNITAGGEGCSAKRSPEARERMRQAKLSNPQRYWLGKKRSPETIAKIRATKRAAPKKPLSEKRKASIATNYAKMLRSKYRPVICLDTGDAYENMASAAAALGCHRTNVWSACNGKSKTVRGKRFSYALKE